MKSNKIPCGCVISEEQRAHTEMIKDAAPLTILIVLSETRTTGTKGKCVLGMQNIPRPNREADTANPMVYLRSYSCLEW